jgi:hypothetical protein
MDKYTQCDLEQGNARMTSWIPSAIASVGNRVVLREERQSEPEIWFVAKTYGTIDRDQLLDMEKYARAGFPSTKCPKSLSEK